MSALNELAMEIRKRDNKEKIGLQIGKVVGVSPFIVEVGKIRAEGTHLKIADNLKINYKVMAIIENSPVGAFETEIRLTDNVLKGGDSVIVAASDNNQTFYVLGRVGGN